MGSKKYICKFCNKNFPCGRSLGGHIRSHLIHNNNNSSNSASNHQPKLSKPGYELRENPKKSKKATKLLNSSSSSSWSNDSETDPSSINKGKDIGKRSSFVVGNNNNNNNNNNSHSSLSEVVEPEEDEVSIAMCLIMLSRDVGKWGNVSSCEISDDILLLQPQETKEFVFDANGVGDTCKKSKNMDFSGCGSLQNGSNMKNNDQSKSEEEEEEEEEEEDENVSTWNLQGGLKLKGNNQYDKPPLNKRKNIDDINSNKNKYEIATNGDYKNWSKIMEFEVCEDNEMTNINKRSKFECTTCNKVFHSYQALGGHRASHKRLSSDQKNSIVLKLDEFANGEDQDHEQSIGDIKIGSTSISSKKVVQKHECPFCFRTFSSGQALGGHKRSHMFASNNNNHRQINLIEISSSKTREFLDLNLPPTHIEEDITTTTTTTSSSNSHAELIKPYWWVEHPKHEPSLSLISN